MIRPASDDSPYVKRGFASNSQFDMSSDANAVSAPKLVSIPSHGLTELRRRDYDTAPCTERR